MKIEIKTEGIWRFLACVLTLILAFIFIIGLIFLSVTGISHLSEDKTEPVRVIKEKIIKTEINDVIVNVNASKNQCIKINGELVGKC